jgi:hypothetical protein
MLCYAMLWLIIDDDHYEIIAVSVYLAHSNRGLHQIEEGLQEVALYQSQVQ